MEAQKVTHGWIEAIKLKFQEFTHQLDLSWPKLTEYGIALGGGILAGFLINRYGRQTLVTILFLSVFLVGLSYLEIITIDWTKISEFVGFAPKETLEGLFQEYWQWAMNHIGTVFMATIGFLIGFKTA
jgi:uncharacterized membrane protein (Fun14 family)